MIIFFTTCLETWIRMSNDGQRMSVPATYICKVYVKKTYLFSNKTTFNIAAVRVYKSEHYGETTISSYILQEHIQLSLFERNKDDDKPGISYEDDLFMQIIVKEREVRGCSLKGLEILQVPRLFVQFLAEDVTP